VIRSIVVLSILAAACGDATLAPSTAPAPPKVAFDAHAKLAVASEEVVFDNGNVPGTIVRPTAPGKYPGIIMMAGSGPTDRNWGSPIIPGPNPSGKLLAEALAAHGAVVLRFDKALTGANKDPVAPTTTIDIYRDEGRAALALLRERHDVDQALLFVLGHSEGVYHATRVALAEGHAIAGVLLLSGTSRTLAQIVLAQIDAQVATAMPDQKDAIHAAMAKAFEDIAAGKPVDPAQVTPIPGLQTILRGLTAPGVGALASSLLKYEPLGEIGKLEVPIFVFGGRKDIQVDPELDAKAIAAANSRSTLFVAPDANHVLEHEDRAKADIKPAQARYYEADRVLDQATVDAIAQWIALTISKR
jgi:pimeloyl-ACP methyl ester carboxylesterase